MRYTLNNLLNNSFRLFLPIIKNTSFSFFVPLQLVPGLFPGGNVARAWR